MTEPETLPAPLVPAHVDCRKTPDMLVSCEGILRSDFALAANDAEFRAGVRLWFAAFHQVPAGSLPNDEALLMALAGYPNNPRGWAKVRARAVSGFALCSDGRLYHPVVAAKALIAWEAKQVQVGRTEAAREAARLKKLSQRQGQTPVAETVTGSVTDENERIKPSVTESKLSKVKVREEEANVSLGSGVFSREKKTDGIDKIEIIREILTGLPLPDNDLACKQWVASLENTAQSAPDEWPVAMAWIVRMGVERVNRTQGNEPQFSKDFARELRAWPVERDKRNRPAPAPTQPAPEAPTISERLIKHMSQYQIANAHAVVGWEKALGVPLSIPLYDEILRRADSCSGLAKGRGTGKAEAIEAWKALHAQWVAVVGELAKLGDAEGVRTWLIGSGKVRPLRVEDTTLVMDLPSVLFAQTVHLRYAVRVVAACAGVWSAIRWQVSGKDYIGAKPGPRTNAGVE